MLIKAYGKFWRADEVDWYPGHGGGRLEMLGRRGERGALEVADFWKQHGIYVLYSDYGPYYVGLARQLALGRRLRHHLEDSHRNKWDRFSWFGFRQVLGGKDQYGVKPLRQMRSTAVGSPGTVIAEMEALLIQSLHTPANKSQMKFVAAGREWKQIKQSEVEMYMGRLKPGRYRHR